MECQSLISSYVILTGDLELYSNDQSLGSASSETIHQIILSQQRSSTDKEKQKLLIIELWLTPK